MSLTKFLELVDTGLNPDENPKEDATAALPTGLSVADLRDAVTEIRALQAQ